MIGGRTGGTQLRKRSVGAQWIGIGSSVACNYEYILLAFQYAQCAPPNLVIIVFLVTNRIFPSQNFNQSHLLVTEEEEELYI